MAAPDPKTDLDDDGTLVLVQQAQAGDRIALNRAFARVRPRLEKWIVARLGPKIRSRLDMEDILQDTLLAAWKGLEKATFTHRRDLFAWLVRVAENRIRDASDYVTAKRRDAARDRELNRSLAMSRTGPGTFVARRERHDEVLDAIASLPEGEREATRLVRLEGMTYAQAAEVLGITSSALGVRLLRAARRIRDHLVLSANDS